jgi:hypothetical protein
VVAEADRLKGRATQAKPFRRAGFGCALGPVVAGPARKDIPIAVRQSPRPKTQPVWARGLLALVEAVDWLTIWLPAWLPRTGTRPANPG